MIRHVWNIKYDTNELIYKTEKVEFPLWLSRLRNSLASMRTWVQSLALLSGLRIWYCHKLQCRSKMWLSSCIAVAVMQASSYISNLICSLGASRCHRCDLTKKKDELPRYKPCAEGNAVEETQS